MSAEAPGPSPFEARLRSHLRVTEQWKPSRPRRLNHVLEIPQTRTWRIDQHRHVAGLVAVGAHQLVGVGDLLPGEHVAHARIDAAVGDEMVGGAGLFQVREMRALNALLPDPDIARVGGDVVAGGEWGK